eukprot:745607-Hanusia_phi.AAC.2
MERQVKSKLGDTIRQELGDFSNFMAEVIQQFLSSSSSFPAPSIPFASPPPLSLLACIPHRLHQPCRRLHPPTKRLSTCWPTA